EIGQLEAFDSLRDRLFFLAGLTDAGEIALDVGHEGGDAEPTEAFRQALQRDGLAGAGGASDEAVPVGKRRQQVQGLFALRDVDRLQHWIRSVQREVARIKYGIGWAAASGSWLEIEPNY